MIGVNREGLDGVDIVGAGDQGMMFGYAKRETESFMPVGLELANRLLLELAVLRRDANDIPYLRADSKSQVTIEYGTNHTPSRINSIVLSTQHDPFDQDEALMLAKVRSDIKESI